MKKILYFSYFFIILIIFTSFAKTSILKEEVINLEKTNINIDKYYIYGTHLNLEGTIPNINYDEIKLVLKNYTKETEYDLIVNDNYFLTSYESNKGINIEDIKVKSYFAIKTKENGETKYYPLTNNTEYNETTYYNLKNKKLVFHFNETFKVKLYDTDEEIYDIVIDAGHGGKDTGAIEFDYNESDFTLEYAKSLKEKLEENGYKVKLTRENDDTLISYGENSRTSIPFDIHAKYLISIHFNSSESPIYRGLEIYSPPHINYDFAKTLVNNINSNTSIDISNNKSYQIEDGICVRTWQEDDIDIMKNDASLGGYEPYDIKENTPYLYMLRETGGIIMNAHIDGRDFSKPKNNYYNSNIGIESYLLELGYLNNYLDLEIIQNEKDAYIEAITNSIKEYIKK